MDGILAAPMDVEELARLGRLKLQCPYYGGRAAVPEADLVLVPYSSLLVKVGVGHVPCWAVQAAQAVGPAVGDQTGRLAGYAQLVESMVQHLCGVGEIA